MQAQATTQPAVPLKILIIEDNLEQVHSLAVLLRDLGHQVDYAINGYVALDVAKRMVPDVVILDIGLPGLDGWEVFRELRSDPKLAAVRVIAFTAYNRDDYRALAKAIGITEYIVKPQSADGWTRLLGDASGWRG